MCKTEKYGNLCKGEIKLCHVNDREDRKVDEEGMKVTTKMDLQFVSVVGDSIGQKT